MITQSLSVQICNNVDEAPKYEKEDGWNGIVLKKVVKVEGGMQSGKPTYDLQFQDDKGNKYVAIITHGVMDSISKL